MNTKIWKQTGCIDFCGWSIQSVCESLTFYSGFFDSLIALLKEQWSSHHGRRTKKDQSCSNCKWSFLEVLKQPFSECNLNVIVNVIGVFRGFPIFSQIERNRWKIRLFGTYIVSNLSPGDASSPVSRTTKELKSWYKIWVSFFVWKSLRSLLSSP